MEDGRGADGAKRARSRQEILAYHGAKNSTRVRGPDTAAAKVSFFRSRTSLAETAATAKAREAKREDLIVLRRGRKGKRSKGVAREGEMIRGRKFLAKLGA